MLKELELTARDIVRCSSVTTKLTRYDVEQGAGTVSFQRNDAKQ